MIIGLCGAAGSGKNTAASLICGLTGAAQIAFADPIYEAVSCITGLSRAKLEDRTIKEAVLDWIDRSPRHLLQTLGTEWGRNTVHQEIWVRRAMERAREAGGLVVITDVRFDNEAEAIHAAGGVVWQVRRMGAGVAGNHASEAGVSERLIDLRIENNGTICELASAVYAALGERHTATIKGE
jgi:hypothetical protein